MGDNITRKRLKQIAKVLDPRDKEILQSIYRFRYLTTGQLRRLHFRESATLTAATRAANRAVAKLRKLSLIDCLERRIGGVRAGSSSFIWGLTEAGFKLFETRKNPARKRFFEPSTKFMTHTIAVAELYIRLSEMPDVEVEAVEAEPDCHRQYAGIGGAPVKLKPDLYTVTLWGDYEDHWFFELDLATESVSRVIRKCGQYLDYYRSGHEQRANGVFPFVAWIVPSKKRKEAMMRRMREELTNTAIFLVSTPDELRELVLEDACGVIGSEEEQHER
ncbi:MAG: replication-relaxation family protein [Treponema sp.]|jgi:hypothetical protein|nr:replication-relaxation family protein [Treponema sp.]